jgi:hypothetical protein
VKRSIDIARDHHHLLDPQEQFVLEPKHRAPRLLGGLLAGISDHNDRCQRALLLLDGPTEVAWSARCVRSWARTAYATLARPGFPVCNFTQKRSVSDTCSHEI